MFDASAPELVLRFSILLLPLLVLAVLFALLYQRHPGGRHAGATQRAAHEDDVATLVCGTAPGAQGATNAEGIFALRQRLAGSEGAAAAELYLELGVAEMQAGNEAVALEALRSAAGLAARDGPARVHAAARIEMAEAALRAGDPTSACEHWQMARMAFLDAGAREDGDKVDRRMRANGCPTDWVLTDF